jgi:hypothetical protein
MGRACTYNVQNNKCLQDFCRRPEGKIQLFSLKHWGFGLVCLLVSCVTSSSHYPLAKSHFRIAHYKTTLQTFQLRNARRYICDVISTNKVRLNHKDSTLTSTVHAQRCSKRGRSCSSGWFTASNTCRAGSVLPEEQRPIGWDYAVLAQFPFAKVSRTSELIN